MISVIVHIKCWELSPIECGPRKASLLALVEAVHFFLRVLGMDACYHVKKRVSEGLLGFFSICGTRNHSGKRSKCSSALFERE